MGKQSLPPANIKVGELLNKIYGTTPDKLKINLARLSRLYSIEPKERAELLKGVNNARDFFEELDWPDAQPFLNELEDKLTPKA